MDKLDKKLLDILQADFPIEPSPFSSLGRQLNCREEQALKRVHKLKDMGVIRKIGPVFDAAKLGYCSTLAAAGVPSEKLDRFVESVNSIPGVSHNYGRKHEFNVWFTLTTQRKELIDKTINQLREEHGIESVFALPAIKTYKIRVHFDFSEHKQGDNRPCSSKTDDLPETNPVINDFDINLIRQLQEDMTVTNEPFKVIADNLGVAQELVLQKIHHWKDIGVIRRFGARIRHQKAGFRNNAMVVFQVDMDRIDQAGESLSRYRQISHCYQRATVPQWPYNLYAMIHSTSELSLRELITEIVDKMKPSRHDVLLSVTEYKKQSVKYFME